MFDLILCILEQLLEGAAEWLMLRFCNLLIWIWHGLASFFAALL
jgi:hypothetical protein